MWPALYIWSILLHMSLFRLIFLSLLIFHGICPSGFSQYAVHVNPFIGTGGHGHTFPGPSMPFGMVQLSPDTRIEGWDGCSGYHYTDSLVHGFSHTHLSGTGVPDYCDVLIMPGTGALDLENQFSNLPVLSSRFDKKNEKASAGTYSTFLDRYGIEVRLTATPRTGVHEYQFPASRTEKWIAIDLRHRDKLLSGSFLTLEKGQISGHRFSSSWAREQKLWFDIRCSAPVQRFVLSKDSSQLICFFDKKLRKLNLQCAISAVDAAGAARNMKAEWMDFGFERARKSCVASWDSILSRVVVKDKKWTKDQYQIFYTALYHLCIQPNLYQDADGRFRGMDGKVHQGDLAHPRYTVFSLWDTYRAAHPFYQLVYPDYNQNFILSFLGQFDECGRLPVWELSANETFCMIGNHSIPVMSYAFLDQNEKYPLDRDRMAKAAEATLSLDFSCMNGFRTGFISSDGCSESVSKTLENSLDWAGYYLLAGRKGYADQYFRNLFNPETGFFQAKLNHKFVEPFDPREVNFHYTEANAWQYLFGAHHDIPGMMECFRFGSKEDARRILEKKLDALFESESLLTGRAQSDITGLIGQYAHGNEPSHHVAYLYNYAGRPDKTRKYLSEITRKFYANAPDGLSGNEDCGQMSAWYLWTTLGFYPVAAVIPSLDPGMPLAAEIRIHPPGQLPLVIKTEGSAESESLASISKNGIEIKGPVRLRSGDEIVFRFGNDSEWAGYAELGQGSRQIGYKPLPYIARGNRVFAGSQELELRSLSDEPILYMDPIVGKTKVYQSPILLDKAGSICFTHESMSKSFDWLCARFDPKPSGFRLKLQTDFAPVYSAGGPNALVDGLSGSSDFRDGLWQGFNNRDVEGEIELDKILQIDSVSISCLLDQRSWILLPSEVSFRFSSDGTHWSEPKLIGHDISNNSEESLIYHFTTTPSGPVRYIRFTLKNGGRLPDWHLSKGEPSWIFADEIKIYPKP